MVICKNYTSVLTFSTFMGICPVPASTIKSVSGNIFFDADNDATKDLTIQSDKVGVGTEAPSSKLHVVGNATVQGKVGVGVLNPKSDFELQGTYAIASQAVSGNVTLTGNSMVFVDAAASGANVDLVLPSPSSVTGRMYTIKKTSQGNTIKITSASTIDGQPEIVLEETNSLQTLAYVEVINDGTEWFILSGAHYSTDEGGLTAWYTFDETSGNTLIDRTPGTQTNGTLNGGFSFSTNTVSGQFGTALVFDGTNDYIDLGDADELFFSTQVTVAVWAKAYTHDGAVWEKSNDWAYGHITMEFDGFGGNPHPYFRVNGSDFTLRSAQANSTSSTTEWVHVVGRYRTSDSEVSIFINGVKQTDTETMAATTSGSASTYRRTFIGAMSNAGNENRFLTGQMDDLRFYYDALTDAQILNLYNQRP